MADRCANLPSDKFDKGSDPYSIGYWARYDGLSRAGCLGPWQRKGWDDCDAELRSEQADMPDHG